MTRPAPKAVHCQIEVSPASQPKPLTVGDRFEFLCDGEIGNALGPRAQFVFADENQKYILHALAIQDSTPQGFKLVVTSYKPGDYKDLSVKISDDNTVVESQPLSWQVQSVIPQGEQPKPFGSMGPFEIHYPIWLWVALAVTLGAIAFMIFLGVHRRRRKLRLRAELESYATMLPPFSQWSRDLRAFIRQLTQLREDQVEEMAAQLDQHFRLYLIRELMVPALQVSDRQILVAIRRAHFAVYDECKIDLLRALSELTNAKKDLGKLKKKDLEDLADLCRRVADKIYRVRKEGVK